jgi:hypothetical protein
MLPHTEITAYARMRKYVKNGSAEHLSALINLCSLIDRHKKLILARAKSRRYVEVEDTRNTVRLNLPRLHEPAI